MDPMYPPQQQQKSKKKMKRRGKPMLKKNPRLNAIAAMLAARGGGR